MSREIDASRFSRLNKNYFSEFEKLLSKIVICYNLMLHDKVNLSNNENEIRDAILFNYLKNNNVRRDISLTDYLFDREVPEDRTAGRTDIKVQTQNTFTESEAYYIFECKRIDNKAKQGISGLNAKYIRNGICRFIREDYSSYYKTNSMIGFVVESMDIHSNTEDINFLLLNEYEESNTITKIKKENFISDFEYHYSSEHKTKNGSGLRLYHLMLDFSDNIKL